MRIDLIRSFSTAKDGNDDSENWLHFFHKGKGEYSWSDVHERRVTVVLGEAGIGKTAEFQNEVDRLQRQGKPAFFIPLNQVLDNESWGRTVLDSGSNYDQWDKSSQTGYFFLDAVDEARLIDHAALERALVVVRAGLRNCLPRVHIAISSRITDWTVKSVRESVRKHLVGPIETALRVSAVGEIGNATNELSTMSQESTPERLEAFVVSLDPLSKSEGRKLADALGIIDATGFWNAIEDGDYEFMATRPLDLEWMVNLWNDKRSLGTYSQLIDGNVSNRLTEVNPSYQSSGEALSLDQLRSGAEQLAAATEFSGKPFVSTTTSAAANEVAPTSTLSDWKPVEITRLLASAVFDEATFGRVKFHHRSIREYLAASWVNRLLVLGLPAHRVRPLFSASPFGIPVLIPSRRATLCWLSALNVAVRDWVTREFPEMLLFEGDPEAWDAISANVAFTDYVERVKDGLWTDWWNNASEFRRLARRLLPGRVANLLSAQAPGSRVITALLPLVTHGHLTDCADVVFGMFRRSEASPREQQYALASLAAVASPEHRAAIKQDLLERRLQSNELISAALAVADWERLTITELVQIFEAAHAESGYGSGPMARVIKEDLLPEAHAASAELLLSAIVAALPVSGTGKRFARFPESEQPERAWLLDVLPDCLERLLTVLPKTLESFPDVCLEAAEHVEAIRDSGFVDRSDLGQLHALVAERPALRWRLALEIAQSEEILHATSRLTWGGSCLVSFGEPDLPALIARANNSNTPQEARNIWFEVGMNLAFRELKGRRRMAALTELSSGPEMETRAPRIGVLKSEWLAGVKQRRQYNGEDRQRKREKRTAHERDRENLTLDIEHIRDGSHAGTLHWLISYSFNYSGRDCLTRVDFDVIARDFGQPIADALASGLIIAWSKATPPNPADYPNGQVPWEAIAGLAGLSVQLARETEFTSLNGNDAGRAAQLAVWELNGPPSWFSQLAAAHGHAVVAALHPWLESEAVLSSEGQRTRGALELALRCSSLVRAKLLQPLVQLVLDNRIANTETLKAILDALREEGLLVPRVVADVCKAKVEASLNADGLVSELGWFRTWLEEDLEGAWAWIESHVAGLGGAAGKQVQVVAGAIVESKWLRNPISEANTAVLMRMHRLLTAHLPIPAAPITTDENGIFGHPIARLIESIPRILVQIRGAAANRALVELAAAETDGVQKNWLNARVMEHAALEAQHLALVEQIALKTFGAPFLSEPRSEGQLFQQVLGRLQEIRKCVQEGPFSDRVLLRKGIPEKHLQLWLAARFLDTQNRRFSVHREEVVDADNRTDIQLSCQHGNVCVEVKPVDRDRSYSATSLVDTLRTQIVGQYLKGLNSAHGILVLFRLDDKTWDIPNGAKAQDFSELVQYLKAQAEIIKGESPSVRELQVFYIDCVTVCTTSTACS